MLYAIAGVSGNTGKAAAEALLAAGEKVRVIVRDAAKGAAWEARGAQVAVADLADAGQLAAALKGADGAYVLVPPRVAPGFRAYQREVGAAILQAVETAAVPHVVLLSSIGAQHPEGTGPIAGLYPVEQGLRALNARNPGIQATFLRAGYFMENLGGSLGGLPHGILPGFAPVDLPGPMVATVDIGRTAATLLREGGQGVQVVHLAGSGTSQADAAAAASRLLGKTIAPVQAPIEALVPTLTGAGMPEDLAHMYLEMYQGMFRGLVAWEVADGIRSVVAPTRVDTVLAGLLFKTGRKVAVLGSGQVAQVLARGFAAEGHDVRIGSRDSAKLAAFAQEAGIGNGTFGQVAAEAEIVVLAVKGTAAETVVREMAPALAGKIVLDATNPIEDAAPEDGILRLFTSPNGSLMERLQALAPEARFVKAFSCVGNGLMVHPKVQGGRPTMFIAGNDAGAKAVTTALLDSFGWNAEDVGTAKGARAIEPLVQLWCAAGFLHNDWAHAFTYLRP